MITARERDILALVKLLTYAKLEADRLRLTQLAERIEASFDFVPPILTPETRMYDA